MNSLFDPALLVRLTCHSTNEFQERAIGWDIDHFQTASGNYQVSLEMVHTRNFQISNVTHHVGIHERGTIPVGAHAISLPFIQGKEPLYFCGGRLGKNECPAPLSGEEFETHSSASVNYISIVTDADLLDREAVLLTGRPFAYLVRSRRVYIQKQDQLQLARAAVSVIQRLKNCRNNLPSRQQELLEKRLIELLLLAIRPPSGKKIKIPNRRLVALKAEQLIRQHPEQLLNIAQLCSLIGCSARTLHLGFKERYGTTPGQYARTLALNAAHQQLCHPTCGKSVSEVAMTWGFYHLGRFSQQYKQLFTELPSTTVKRSRELGLGLSFSNEGHLVAFDSSHVHG